MLVVTIAWPAIALVTALVKYNDLIWSQAPPEQMSTFGGQIATIAVYSGITFLTLLPVWMLAIAILGVIYFATRR
jgi:hypothetical protein